jgi:hypothetical protein
MEPSIQHALEECLRQPGVLKRLERYANTRAAPLSRFRSIEGLAQDLVHRAILAICAGKRVWDHSISFEVFLRGVIRSMANHDYAHAKTYPQIQLIDEDTGDDDLEPSAVLQLSLIATTDPAHQPRREQARALLAVLRQIAANDTELLLVLEAYAQGAFQRNEVLELTNLTAHHYRAALCRLRRLRHALPKHLAW